MSYPILYEANATDFFNNGLGTLPDAISSLVTEERNGEFVLDMTYPLHGTRANQIKNNRIIKVDAGHKLTDQRFVIKTVTPAMNTSGQTIITVHAEHVSYLANDLAIKPHLNVNNTTAEQALRLWNGNLTTPNQFTVDSDITTRNNTAWSIDKFQTGRQVLGGVEGSILDVWGGDYRFDNLHVSLLKNRGTIANTLLAYGRNITSFEQENNIIDTYTSVYPFFIQRGDKDKQDTIYTIDNYVVDSSNVNKFPNKSVLPIDVSGELGDIKVGSRPKDSTADDKTEYISVSTLKKRMKSYAQQYINNNNIGVPKVSIKVSFVDLARTSNYADVAPLEQLDLCDEVPVRFSELNIDTTAKVSRIIWNVLTDSYDSIELGEISATLGDKISQVEHSINKTNDRVDQVNNIVQTGADGKSTVFRGQDTPTANHTGDLWYKPNGEDTEMYQWDGVSWHFVMSTKDTGELSDKINQAMQEMADKEKEINGKLKSNQIDISQAQKDLEQVKQDTANQLADIRDSVVKDVADVKAQSKDALDKANSIDGKASQALENATDAKETAITVATDIDSVRGELSSKADKSTVDTINQTVSDQGTKITQNANDIKSKASSSDVDKLSGRVSTAETTLTQTANGLKGKADKTELDKTNNSLTTLSNNFSTTSAGFNASLSKIDDKVNSNKEDTNSALSVAKADIKATADNLSTNYTKTTDEHNYVNSQIKQSADQINLSVASVSDKVDGMEIGGRNYAKDSNKEVFIGGPDSNGKTWSRYAVLPLYGIQEFSPNETLVVSTYVKDVINTDEISIGISLQNANDGLYTVNAKIVNGRAYGVIKVNPNLIKFTNIIIYSGAGNWNGSENKYITAYNYQLEKGNVPSDYHEAPEDTDSKIAALQIDADGIKQTVSNKADTSYVDQKANQITTTVGNKADISYVDQQDKKIQSTVASKADASQITQLSDRINLKVNQSDFDNLQIGGRNLLFNTNFTINKNGDSVTNIDHVAAGDMNGDTFTCSFLCDYQNVSAISGKKRILFQLDQYDKDNNLITYGGIDVHPQVGDTHWGRISKTFNISPNAKIFNIGVYIQGIDAQYMRVGYPKLEKGKITTEWNQAPEDLTTADNVVSQINIDKSGVLIQGKKIMIDGDTYIKNGVIKSAMIDTLDANKITTGTLNAANVNIINMNVNKLVGNTTSFVQSAWNGISSYVNINSDGIDVGLWDASVSLKSDGMHIYDDFNGEDLGMIHGQSMEGYPNINGLTFDLNKQAEYMAWGERSDDVSNYDMKFYWSRKYVSNVIQKGFTFDDNVAFRKNVYIYGSFKNNVYFNSGGYDIYIGLRKFNNNNYKFIGTNNGKSGIYFGNSLMVLSNGVVTSLSGMKIPTQINSDGTVERWYNM